MNAQDMQTLLQELLYGEHDSDSLNGLVRAFRSYAESGVMTRDAGLVVTMVDGSEFQITVIQSQQADEPAFAEDDTVLS